MGTRHCWRLRRDVHQNDVMFKGPRVPFFVDSPHLIVNLLKPLPHPYSLY